MKKKESFIKQSMQLAIGAILNLIIGVFTTPLITRLVDPTQYGELSLFNTYSSIALMIFSVGLDQTFVRYYYIQEESEYKKKLLKVCLGIPIVFTGIGSIILMLLHAVNPLLLGFNNIVTVCFIINIFVLVLNRFGMLLVRLEFNTFLYSVLNVLHKFLYVIIALPLILFFDTDYLFLLIIATIMSLAIPTFICFVNQRKLLAIKDKDTILKIDNRELIRFGLPLMVASGVFLVFQAMDKMCIKYYGTYYDVGVYSSAQSLMAVFAIVQSTFNTLWAPKSIQYYENNKEDRSYYVKMNKMITIVMFSFGVFVLLFKDIIVLLLGEKYRAATAIIPFLMFNPIMYTVSETTVVGLNITKHTKCQMIITGASCLINFIGNMILIPIMGAKGAAVSTGVSYIVFFTLRTLFSNHYFPVKYPLLRYYILTGMFAAFALYSIYNSFDIITLLLGVGILCSIVVLYRDTIGETCVLVKEIIFKKLKMSK